MPRYAELAERLYRRHGLKSVVQFHGRAEQEAAMEIVTHAGGSAIPAPMTDIPGLTSLLREASLFVGSDTGPLHLAAAVGTPTVALFGPTRREENAPAGDQHVALQEYHQTGTSRKRSDNHAMREISVESVFVACSNQIARLTEPTTPTGSACRRETRFSTAGSPLLRDPGRIGDLDRHLSTHTTGTRIAK